MTTTLPLLANSELVTLAWVRDVVTAYGVGGGTTLQGPDPETQVLSWGDTGFVTTAVVGGSVYGDVPMRTPVMSVDCYAAAVGRPRPPWGRANAIAELIVAAARSVNWGDTQRPVTLPSGYPIARVVGAVVLGEPKRRPADPANYAKYGFELQIHWLTP